MNHYNTMERKATFILYFSKIQTLLLLSLAVLATTAGTTAACTILPNDHVINTPIDCLPIDSNSDMYINTIGATTVFHPDFGSGLWQNGPIGIPFIEVTSSQTKYPASFLYSDESDNGIYAIPLTAPIEGGSNSNGDRHVIAVNKEQCTLYELYRGFPNEQSQSWTADSGIIVNMSSYTLRPETWTSADAAGLYIYPSLIKYNDVYVKGEINHAIRFTVSQTQKKYVWPARHYASTIRDVNYPPMGQRFRLKSSYDITKFSKWNQIILTAMKKYGIILADNGSNWFISGEPHPNWNNTDLRQLKTLIGSNFEAVNISSLIINNNSGQANQICSSPTNTTTCGNGICESSAVPIKETIVTCFQDCCRKKGSWCLQNKSCCSKKCSRRQKRCL